jgi:hypothetical protein
MSAPGAPSGRVRRAPHPAQRGRGEPGKNLGRGEPGTHLDPLRFASVTEHPAVACWSLRCSRAGLGRRCLGGPQRPNVSLSNVELWLSTCDPTASNVAARCVADDVLRAVSHACSASFSTHALATEMALELDADPVLVAPASPIGRVSSLRVTKAPPPVPLTSMTSAFGSARPTSHVTHAIDNGRAHSAELTGPFTPGRQARTAR